jgi:uncharacterized membrane protein
VSLEELRLSPFGLLHTAIGLFAVASGVVALVRHGAISPRTVPGRLYVVATVVTCLTGFGLFRHGGFDEPHALGVLTLVVLALAGAAGRGRLGRASCAIETVAYSATLFFHAIPGLAETLTRLPPGAPLFADREAPGLQRLAGLAFLLFLGGAWLQVRRLRRRALVTASPGSARGLPVSSVSAQSSVRPSPAALPIGSDAMRRAHEER